MYQLYKIIYCSVLARLRGLVISFVLLCVLAPATHAQNPADKLHVVASIAPLAMIAEAVAGDVVDIKQLMPAVISPHDYRLTFSGRRLVAEADLVIWVGPQMETVLTKSLKDNPERVLTATDIAGIHWPEVPEEAGHDHDLHNHNASHKHNDPHNHQYGKDPHIWLNPNNAVLIAEQVARRIAHKLPEHGPQLAANLAAFKDSVATFIESSREQTQLVQGAGFIVLHDAYRHLVDFYQLNQIGVIRHSSGGEKGLRHRAMLLALAGEMRCVFAEPQFPERWAIQVAEPLGAEVVELDPMGIHTAEPALGKPYRYVQLMQQLVDNLTACLARQDASQL